LKFWFPCAVDVVIAIIVLYFFLVGLADGSVSSFNIGLWLLILLGLGSILGGSLWLKTAGHPTLAMVLLLILAIPGLLYGLFLLALVIAAPRWN
jgi:vacuolar-type H+-ATPase subunit I/STV1